MSIEFDIKDENSIEMFDNKVTFINEHVLNKFEEVCKRDGVDKTGMLNHFMMMYINGMLR